VDGAVDGAGADDEAGTLGATDGATDGTGGTGVGDEVHAESATNRDSDNVTVAIARFIGSLQDRVGQRIGPLRGFFHPDSRC
jgi:hypothetical protein